MSDKPNNHDLVVFSDLHLGEGFLSELGRYSPMEDFFHDDSFARLLDQLSERYAENPSRLVVVLNGDTFDFLTVTRLPDAERCKASDLTITQSERRFGLNPTPKKSVFKLECIVAGHRPFFAALARMIKAGHRVEILRGNHDLEIYFTEIQDRLCELLAEFPEGPSVDEVRQRVRFHQWFYLEPGRLYIEHGNQYEASNSIRYPLHPLLPLGRWTESEALLDYPLGSLFVRYFYNRVHHLNPYTPKVISFEQYLEFLRRYNLLDLLRVARDHYPFFVAALKPRTTSGRSRPSSREDAAQEAAFQSLEETTEPKNLYRQLNQLKVHPLAASKLALTRQMLKPIIKRILWISGAAIAALYVWLLIFHVIQAPLLSDSVFARATLLLFFTLITLVAVLWVGNHLVRRLRRQTDVTVETCAERADQIARLTGVKMVLMGHTHVVDYRLLAGGQATYANSGSWVAVDNPWNRLVPDARRLTFQYVQGDKVRVCRWNDDASRIDDVPLFNLTDDQARLRYPEPAPPRPVEIQERTWRKSKTFEEKDDR